MPICCTYADLSRFEMSFSEMSWVEVSRPYLLNLIFVLAGALSSGAGVSFREITRDIKCGNEGGAINRRGSRVKKEGVKK
jgi:hypothetical protein